MNKLEISMVGLLFALLLAWGFWSRPTVPPPRPESAALQGATNAPPPGLPADTALKAVPAELPAPAAPSAEPVAALGPEETVEIAGDGLKLLFSSHFGGIVRAELDQFRVALSKDSGPLKFDLSRLPALSFHGGLFASNGTYRLHPGEDQRSIRIERNLPGGLVLQRSVRIENGYRLSVTDEITNSTASQAAVPAYGVAVGPMSVDDPKKNAADLAFLGLDSLAVHGGERTKYWMQSGMFSKSPVAEAFRTGSGEMPASVVYRSDAPVLWAAAKSKFFVQVLHVGEETAGCDLWAWRVPEPGKNAVIHSVGATVRLPAAVIEPGGSLSRAMSYYLGPKKYDLLKTLPHSQDEVMDFGHWFGWICKILLPLLNWIHHVLPSYGVAIILLTIIVRMLFWPLTHKSTESMKKMQELQPQVAQIREKFKDKPQKMNQEMMALYKVNKVNPMSGCIPMLVQIPVFIALFTVLQSAVELRFAPFLWIKDLSQPENLLLGVWPLPFGLNLLPLVMTGLTVWQQKITPSAGDPQQQKIMMWMPVIFLFLFYSMASALVLYWTVSQAISILQVLKQRHKVAHKQAAVAPPVQGKKRS